MTTRSLFQSKKRPSFGERRERESASGKGGQSEIKAFWSARERIGEREGTTKKVVHCHIEVASRGQPGTFPGSLGGIPPGNQEQVLL